MMRPYCPNGQRRPCAVVITASDTEQTAWWYLINMQGSEFNVTQTSQAGSQSEISLVNLVDAVS